MSSQKPPVSFDEIIKAAREKRKNEALANEIFGRGRRASAPSTTGSRNTHPRPSLASRVGVVKRTASNAPKQKANNINGQWSHDLHRLNNPQASRVSQLPLRTNSARIMRDNRLYAALQSDGRTNGAVEDNNNNNNNNNNNMTMNIRGATSSNNGGLAIRGAAGPFTVRASNFAPGTTASDIEASMASIGGEIISCRLISAHPTVIAEIIFPDKVGAENVIATFNNQRADGRLLYVHMVNRPNNTTTTTGLTIPSGPRARSQNTHREKGRDFVYDQSQRGRAPNNTDFQDGRYGFDHDDDEEMEDAGGLYSDNIISSRGRRYR